MKILKLVPRENKPLRVISPGKDIYYGTLRCCTLPRQEPTAQFLRQVFLLPIQCRFFFPTKGHGQNFLRVHSVQNDTVRSKLQSLQCGNNIYNLYGG